ncbi:MAG: acetoin utilization protein AcuC [bacterium]|nr:acetoin utilization protein AcuC [bacterium]
MTSLSKTARPAEVAVYYGEALARYGFGDQHPFGTDRLAAFWNGLESEGLIDDVIVTEPVTALRDDLEAFHTRSYVEYVIAMSKAGVGFLDSGDTPAFPGVYEAGCCVVGSVLDAVTRIMDDTYSRAFVPVAGLHHARRDRAGGFCVFNDCGVAIEHLRHNHDVQRIAYIDIDAHHGDGVFYEFEDDVDVFIGDIHEDGRFLYPGTGSADETGRGTAAGSKINIPLPPGAGDSEFLSEWGKIEERLEAVKPEFILLQCGADGLVGDPLTHLRFSDAGHSMVTRALRGVADRHCGGRILALGGGGYNHHNIARAWCAVVRELVRQR